MLVNKFVYNPSEWLKPVFRISPFNNNDIFKNREIVSNMEPKVFSFFSPGYKELFLRSGRDALKTALNKLKLSNSDIVTILTTTGNVYISGCVTNEIEQVCKWSRFIEPNTKVLLINHEFGFPYERLAELKSYGFPIIEDCAYSFLSQNEQQNVGSVGDFIIYSLPKIFPIQFGGILKYKEWFSFDDELLNNEIEYLEKLTNYYNMQAPQIKIKRVENYYYYANRFAEIGIKTKFEMKEGICPGVFMFYIPEKIDLASFKLFMQKNGIESSIFYGERVYFLPVNQCLEKNDLDYIFECVKYYTKRKVI